MSTEVETYTPSTDLATVTGRTGANLIREAAAVMADAHLLAKAVCSTQMVPKHFQGKPDECAAAMLYGASLGLDPMQSVRQIYVVHGQAALYARAMSALVQGAGHKVWTVESTDQSVTVHGSRRGSSHVEPSTWTYARAKKAGYTNNSKYDSDPQAMLYSKALSEVCRKIAPDVLSGVYSVEEMQLEERAAAPTPAAKPQGMAAVKAAVQPTPEPAPEVEAEVVATGEVAPATLVRKVNILLKKAGYASDEDRFGFLSHGTGRDITSSKQLTVAEAEGAIQALEARLADAAAAQEALPTEDPQ